VTIALGEAITGKPVVTDLAGAPHMLAAGITGPGKSAEDAGEATLVGVDAEAHPLYDEAVAFVIQHAQSVDFFGAATVKESATMCRRSWWSKWKRRVY
jgi:DNA segregation ATPase FtsK/SpoIIIE-like protein